MKLFFMKALNNRQKKTFPLRFNGKSRLFFFSPAYDQPYPFYDAMPPAAQNGVVYGLLSNIQAATRVAKAAKHHQFGIHNFDKAEPLIKQMKAERPKLVIVDWDGREAESFKFLNELRRSADLKGVSVIGFASGMKQVLRTEAQMAGCQRVYSKTEFMNQLEDLMGRWAV